MMFCKPYVPNFLFGNVFRLIQKAGAETFFALFLASPAFLFL